MGLLRHVDPDPRPSGLPTPKLQGKPRPRNTFTELLPALGKLWLGAPFASLPLTGLHVLRSGKTRNLRSVIDCF